MHVKHRLDKFLAEYPLYKKFHAVENFSRIEKDYSGPFYLHGETTAAARLDRAVFIINRNAIQSRTSYVTKKALF